MTFSTQQLQALRTAILADATALAEWNIGDDTGVANRMNQIDVTFFLWRSDASVQTIFEQITWANLTPADAPDSTQTWMNRALACQGKQFSIQTMLTGRSTLDATRSTLRSGLQDALTNVPSGTGGAAVSAGWVGVRDTALKRNAKLVEKALADTSSGNGLIGTPAVPVFQGNLMPDDIPQIRMAP